jgi:hypothetical protein
MGKKPTRKRPGKKRIGKQNAHIAKLPNGLDWQPLLYQRELIRAAFDLFPDFVDDLYEIATKSPWGEGTIIWNEWLTSHGLVEGDGHAICGGCFDVLMANLKKGMPKDEIIPQMNHRDWGLEGAYWINTEAHSAPELKIPAWMPFTQTEKHYRAMVEEYLDLYLNNVIVAVDSLGGEWIPLRRTSSNFRWAAKSIVIRPGSFYDNRFPMSNEDIASAKDEDLKTIEKAIREIRAIARIPRV